MREAIMDEGGNHGCECSTRRAGSPDEGGNQRASTVAIRCNQDAIKELRRHLMRGVISANHRSSDAIKTQSRSFGGT
jgi:hypothetical protein